MDSIDEGKPLSMTPAGYKKVRQLAAVCGVSPQAVYYWVKQLGLPTVKVDGIMLISDEEFKGWIRGYRELF